MLVEQQPQSIPNFLSASTPQGLRRLMLRNNARIGAWINYFALQSVIQNGKPVWFVWYYEPIQHMKDIDAMLQGGEK